MRNHMSDIDAAEIVSHIHNEAIPIPADVEDHLPRADEITGGEVGLHLKVLPVALSFHHADPVSQLLVRVRVLAPEGDEARGRDDVHSPSFS
jgi:hypothetical protein